MSGLPLQHLWVKIAITVTLSLSPAQASPILSTEPIRCAPCTPEKLLECPAVAPDCEEALREPGCGCCLTCALKKGQPCGVYTAPCSSGLRCSPRPDDPRPLHSLTRGNAVCAEAEQSESLQNADNSETNTDGSAYHLLGLKPYDPKNVWEAQESLKAKINAIRKKLVEQGPCHVELQQALEGIATSQQALGDKFTTFYLPNCDKHGFYKSKQCETSLAGEAGRCWCVSSWNGKMIPGSSGLLAESGCQQELTH